MPSLLFGNGIHNPLARGDFSCLKNINLALPREKRRSITGTNDGIFGGGNLEEVLKQQKETSGYDCGDRLDCFANEMPVPNTYLGKDSVIEGEYDLHTRIQLLVSIVNMN